MEKLGIKSLRIGLRPRNVLGGVHATPVYEFLGEAGFETTTYPEVGEFLSKGKLAFRIHEGGYNAEPNWPFL